MEPQCQRGGRTPLIREGQGIRKSKLYHPVLSSSFLFRLKSHRPFKVKAISCFPRKKYCSFILDATFSADLRRDLGRLRACMIISVILVNVSTQNFNTSNSKIYLQITDVLAEVYKGNCCILRTI